MITLTRAQVLVLLMLPLLTLSVGYAIRKYAYGSHRDFVVDSSGACRDQNEPDLDIVQDVKIRELDRRLDVLEPRLDKHADRLRALEATEARDKR